MAEFNLNDYSDEQVREVLSDVLSYSETLVKNLRPLVEDDNSNAKGASGTAEDIIAMIHERLNKKR